MEKSEKSVYVSLYGDYDKNSSARFQSVQAMVDHEQE